MNSEIENLLSLLHHTFEKNAWHGPSVKEVLRDINADQAFKRLEHTHSIIELVAHMTAWRVFVIKKLQGEIDYKVGDEQNFPTSNDWTTVLNDLFISQDELLEQLKNFPGPRLSEVVPHGSYRYTFFTLLHGIIHHDLYHIGQIALIKKSLG
jgi:uncharacterized damage-inducible protein DinB